MGVGNLLVQLDKVERLTFDKLFAPKDVDELISQVALLELGCRDPDIILACCVIFNL